MHLAREHPRGPSTPSRSAPPRSGLGSPLCPLASDFALIRLVRLHFELRFTRSPREFSPCLAPGSRRAPRSAHLVRLGLEALEDRAVPATFNVTTTLDVIDLADGKRSLREAITAANNRAGNDEIVVPAG